MLGNIQLLVCPMVILVLVNPARHPANSIYQQSSSENLAAELFVKQHVHVLDPGVPPEPRCMRGSLAQPFRIFPGGGTSEPMVATQAHSREEGNLVQ